MNPTHKTMNNPTNFTEIQQASIVPQNNSHSHHVNENSAVLFEETLTAPSIDPTIKNNNNGSNRIYWFRVSIPTSKNNIILVNKILDIYISLIKELYFQTINKNSI